jgi:hypothetical protein
MPTPMGEQEKGHLPIFTHPHSIDYVRYQEEASNPELQQKPNHLVADCRLEHNLMFGLWSYVI